MLTPKPSYATNDAQGGDPRFTSQGMPSVYATIPPTPDPGAGWEGGEPEACRLVLVNLSAYLDNELDPDQAQLITRHLNSCAGCAAQLEAMEEADAAIQREWREDAPLPSSSQFRSSVDAIMDALPPAPAPAEPFAPRRVHSRARWTRFATGLSSVILAAGLLWSSYRLGYSHGQSSVKRSSASIPASATMQPARSLLALSAPPLIRSLSPPSASASSESRP